MLNKNRGLESSTLRMTRRMPAQKDGPTSISLEASAVTAMALPLSRLGGADPRIDESIRDIDQEIGG